MQWTGLYLSGINESLYSPYANSNKMLSVRVFDRMNLAGISKQIEKAAEQGVEAAVEDTVEWIKDDVIRGQSYVGHQYYPDNSAATKRIKSRKGKTKVLVDTSNYLSSWDGKTQNMKGIIRGGGGVAYAKSLYDGGWKIDLLWKQEHSKISTGIIEKAVKKAI